MDVFRVRDQLIEDYRDFTGSFVDIHDKRIAEHVAERMSNGPPVVCQDEFERCAVHFKGTTKRLQRLLAALEIPRPGPTDMVAVLQELSDAPLAPEDRAVVPQTTAAGRTKSRGPRRRGGSTKPRPAFLPSTAIRPATPGASGRIRPLLCPPWLNIPYGNERHSKRSRF